MKHQHQFLLGKKNFIIVLAGIGFILLGFILMIGGGAENPNEYPEETLYGFRTTILAPILVVIGFILQGYAILKKPDDSDSSKA